MKIERRRSFVSIAFSASLMVVLSGSASAADLPLSPTPAARAVALSAPTIDPPADMMVHAGLTADQTIHANDVDGDPLTFLLNAGPSYMTVVTTDPGSGAATGTIHLAPKLTDAGADTGIVAIYDGVNYRLAPPFQIAIFPTLDRPVDMTVSEGATADQTLRGSDTDGYTMIFSLVSGPTFATVTTTSDSTGLLHLAPGSLDSGHYTARVGVGDGIASRTSTLQILVNNVTSPPVLQQPLDMHATTNTYSQQVLVASDPDQDGLTFQKVVGPGYMTVGNASQLPPRGYVNLFYPFLADTGAASATVRVSDGVLSDQRSFTIHVDTGNSPPVVHSARIDLEEGADLATTLVLTDTDGQRLFVTWSNLPTFMTTLAPQQALGSDSTLIPLRFLPTFDDAGTYSPILRVSDGDQQVADTLVVRVRDSEPGETSLRVRKTGPGGVIEKRYSVLDGTFGVAPLVFLFTATTGSGATWGTRSAFPWAEGDYQLDPVTVSFGAYGGDTTGQDLVMCCGVPQTLQVHRVRQRLDGSISSLWATFQQNRSDGVLETEIRYQVPNIPVTLIAPHWLSVNSNQRLVFQVSAVDSAHDSISLSASGLPVGAAFVDGGNGQGTFGWIPTRFHSGNYTIPIIATSAGGLADTALTVIYVTSLDLPPVAMCGGPYTGTAGIPLLFSSSGSTDPDGDGLTYRWTFGDGGLSTERTPLHTYAVAGYYPISLVVSDGLLAGGDQTLTTILEPDSIHAVAVLAPSATDHPIRLEAGGARFCVAMELQGTPARIQDIDPTTLRMRVKGLGNVDAITADPVSFTFGDSDRNGAPDVTACFTTEGLRALFAKVRGSLHVFTTVEFSLLDGHGYRASLPVDVVGPDGTLRPLAAPNPLRPTGTFSFVTTLQGRARLTLYDSHGRRVRTLLDVESLATGYHDLPIDGRSQEGRSLSSGTYFYRLETAEGTRSGRLTIFR